MRLYSEKNMHSVYGDFSSLLIVRTISACGLK